jgi:glycosyltransferase involved in cell wall biosynthesis
LHIFFTALLGAIAATWTIQAVRAARGMQRLPWLDRTPAATGIAEPFISVIFAARDEAEALPDALPTLLGQDYPNYEVIAVNDRSRDATGAILRQFARTSNRLKVVEIDELPPGWLGKSHALMRGAEQASGEWLVFTDADVHFAPHVLRRAIGLAFSRGWDHMTLVAGLDMRGFWETTLLTFFYIGFVVAAEPWRVADTHSSRYAGIGAFQMLRRSAYDAIGGHHRLALEVVEDMKLGKLVKQGGFRSGLGFAEESIRLRWYSGLRSIVGGLTKNVFAALGFSVPTAALWIALLLLMSVLPFFAVVFATGWARAFAALAAGLAMGFHAAASWRAGRSPLYVLTHPLGAVLFAYITARSMAVTLARGGVTWRDTFYPLQELRRGQV